MVPPIIKIMNNIDDTEQFSEQFADFISKGIPYCGEDKERTKSLYMIFFLSLVLVTGYRHEINFKEEPGKPDVLIKTPWYDAIIEFKVSDSEIDEVLQKTAEEALRQIDDRRYWHELITSPIPLYKIGIACHGKKCRVKTVLHE